MIKASKISYEILDKDVLLELILKYEKGLNGKEFEGKEEKESRLNLEAKLMNSKTFNLDKNHIKSTHNQLTQKLYFKSKTAISKTDNLNSNILLSKKTKRST